MSENTTKENNENEERMELRYRIKIFNGPNMTFNEKDDGLIRREDELVSFSILKGPNENQQLMDCWNYLLGDHEGMEYSVFDIVQNQVIVSGAFDPDDIEVVEDYIVRSGNEENEESRDKLLLQRCLSTLRAHNFHACCTQTEFENKKFLVHMMDKGTREQFYFKGTYKDILNQLISNFDSVYIYYASNVTNV